MTKTPFLSLLTASFLLAPWLSNAQEHASLPCGNGCKNQEIVKQIDGYIGEVVNLWQLPGLAAAFSIDGKQIYAKGFGTKELRPASGIGFKGSMASDTTIASGGYKGVTNVSGSPIDENTVFQIGSVSKSFTATVIADLIDEGKLKWEDTVINILPDFKLYDPWVTQNLQVKDVMTHRTGLAGQAGTYIPNLGYSRDDVYRMMARIKPAYSFRGAYEYNNITFIIAEKIIEKITGKSWEENVKERIFEPLGMNSSSLNAAGFATAANVATPHDYSWGEKGISTLPLYGNEQALYWLTVVGPAGSVCSSVNDMARYAQMHCNNGWYARPNAAGGVDTVRIMSEKAMRTLHRGVTITSQNDTRTTLYAPCWFVEQNNRYRLYFHTGTTWGMTALCFYVPEINFSGVILVNSEANTSPRYAIMRRAVELMLAAKEGKDLSGTALIASLKDYNKADFEGWSKEAKEGFEKAAKEKTAAVTAAAKSGKKLPPVPDKKALVGRYKKDELFGDARITLEGGDLYVSIGKMGYKNKLNHVEGLKYEFRSDGHAFPLLFTEGDKGVSGFTIEFNYGEEKDFGGWIKE